jgi:hypothetical protein
MSWVSTAFKAVFGSSDNGKSIAETAVDTYERFNPGEVKQHEMSIEQQQAGDASQDSARAMIFASHASWFDIFIDGLNRSVRPFFTFWAIGMLMGWWDTTVHWDKIPEMAWNIIWTIVTFWFGSRVIFKDIPLAVKAWKVMNKD